MAAFIMTFNVNSKLPSKLIVVQIHKYYYRNYVIVTIVFSHINTKYLL
jgi:hypothetical protein